MKTWKFIKGFITIVLIISLCRCTPPEIILHGDISGFVTESESNLPIQDAFVELLQSHDTIDIDTTLSDGSYQLINLRPGDYEIEASKPTYEKVPKNVTVTPANTAEVDFELIKAPYGAYSDTYLDFGIELTSMSFTISNAGPGTFSYSLHPRPNCRTSLDPISPGRFCIV